MGWRDDLDNARTEEARQARALLASLRYSTPSYYDDWGDDGAIEHLARDQAAEALWAWRARGWHPTSPLACPLEDGGRGTEEAADATRARVP